VCINPAWKNFIGEFPFLTLDKSIPFDLPQSETDFIEQIFQKISVEYESNHPDRITFIQAYTHLLLLSVRRCYESVANTLTLSRENRRVDQQIVAQMQQLISRYLTDERIGEQVRSPSFYAEQLNMHPNHLNAIVKRISGKTASQLVQEGIISAAKSLLNATSLSVKEVAYQLHFSEPTHFVGFFKKYTSQTPHQFREMGRR
jgi:AraC-like DNA-binding protein